MISCSGAVLFLRKFKARTRSNVLFKWDCHKKKQNTPGGCLSLTGRVLFFQNCKQEEPGR